MINIENYCMGCFSQLESSGGVCPVCGYSEAAQATQPHQLRPHTILNGKYLAGRVLGQGGFGITYIGWDLNLDMKVAIKEYYPSGFVTRETTVTSTVQPFTGSQGDFFLKGRERFIGEAKSLAKFFSLPGIVSVKDYFPENGTTYIVMEYIEGRTLKDYLSEMGGRLPAAQVLDMMKPVMTSLAEVHKSGIIHRDISPDNIMISKDGYMKLLDFGAAREFADSGNKSLSIMLKPGFAPEEQYRTKGEQGPWTDVYALSATIYKCITGVTPAEALDRLHGEIVAMPRQLGAVLTPGQEAAVMRGMSVGYNERFMSITELYAALYDGVQPPPPKPSKSNPLTAWIQKHKFLAGVLSCVAAIVLLVVIFGGDETTDPPGVNPTNTIEMMSVVSFPDPNFEAAVRETINKPTGDITRNDVVGVTVLDVAKRGIADLSGIEYFTALKTLYCYNNVLTTLDVSKNTALITVSCYGNRITTLNVSGNTALAELDCSKNQLTVLDISKNTALTFLNCHINQLISLDVSNNTALETLSCTDNQFTVLELSNNKALTKLWCGGNQLTSLDLSANNALTALWCENNYFPDTSVILGLDESKIEIVFEPQKKTEKMNVTDKAYVYTTKLLSIPCVYTGEWENNAPNGEGVLTYTEDWSSDDGTLSHSAGDTLKGTFINGLLEGQGEYNAVNGFHSEGAYKNGLRNGQGMFIDADGNSYKGNFVDDLPDGQGKITFADGETLEGEFKNGKPNGYCTYKDAQGNILQQGTWVDGEFQIPTANFTIHNDTSVDFTVYVANPENNEFKWDSFPNPVKAGNSSKLNFGEYENIFEWKLKIITSDDMTYE